MRCPVCGKAKGFKPAGIRQSPSFRHKSYEISVVEFFTCMACGEEVSPRSIKRKVKTRQFGKWV